MGLEFLRNNGAHRMRDDAIRPLLLDDSTESGEMQEQERTEMGYERDVGKWGPIDTWNVSLSATWAHCPKLFIDGKDVGRTVAWLQRPVGYLGGNGIGQFQIFGLRHLLHRDQCFYCTEFYIAAFCRHQVDCTALRAATMETGDVRNPGDGRPA